MSNLVQIVKDMYAAFGRGDIAAIMANLADDVSWEAEGPAEMVFTGIRHGKTEALGFFQGLATEHTDPNLQMTEFVPSEDSVAVFGRYQTTIKKTGRRVDVPLAHLWKFRNGKVVRYVNVTDTAAFVEAARSATA